MPKTASRLALASLLALASCQMQVRTVKPAPLDAEAEVWLYLDPLAAQAERLSFSLETVAVTRQDGQDFPLELLLAEVGGKEARRQRLVARGRVPPGDYVGLSVRVKKAALATDDGPPSTLLVGAEPVRVGVSFAVRRAQARVVALGLDFGRSIDKGFAFRPALAAYVPAMPIVDLLAFATDTGSDSITVMDKQTRKVAAVVPTGRDPRGLAIDRLRSRLYVALGSADEIAAHDLQTGDELGRARLRPGDRPHEVVLSGDGQTLVCTNNGSNSASFVDPVGLVEVGRAQTGIAPTALVLDRSGRRAYAFNQGASTLTVLDIAGRASAGSIPTDGVAARGSLNRTGDRLYLVSPNSSYLSVLSVPGFASVARVYVGFNAVSVQLDPRTDYAYVSMGDTGELQVFPPLASLPIGRVQLPGPATWQAIDDAFDRMILVIPSRSGSVSMDLTSRNVLPLVDLGADPYAAAVVGERR